MYLRSDEPLVCPSKLIDMVSASSHWHAHTYELKWNTSQWKFRLWPYLMPQNVIVGIMEEKKWRLSLSILFGFLGIQSKKQGF